MQRLSYGDADDEDEDEDDDDDTASGLERSEPHPQTGSETENWNQNDCRSVKETTSQWISRKPCLILLVTTLKAKNVIKLTK